MLVLAICALAARFSPALSAFRGTGALSAAYFSDAARRLLYDALDEPTLETCQAGYLLGITDLGAGKGRRGWMVQGIAIRSECAIGLHMRGRTDEPGAQWRFCWACTGMRHTSFRKTQARRTLLPRKRRGGHSGRYTSTSCVHLPTS